MTIKTLREIIDGGFEGFPRQKLSFWSSEDLPNQNWSDDYVQSQDFSKGENFEVVPLRTWVCTDTPVGLTAVLWDGKLIAFTYQAARKSNRDWSFVAPHWEKKMHEVFKTYASEPTEDTCEVLRPDDDIYTVRLDPAARYDWQTGPLSKEDFSA